MELKDLPFEKMEGHNFMENCKNIEKMVNVESMELSKYKEIE